MDTQRFDELTRSLASSSSRRMLLRGMVGGALAVVGFRAAGSAAAEKADICHYDVDSGTYHRISVSVNALRAHEAHGDNNRIGCPEGANLDIASCTCICQPTACDDGFEFNHETCECEPDPLTQCAGSDIGDPCAGGEGVCAQIVSGSDFLEMICVTQDPGDACDDVNEDCQPGEVCVLVPDFGGGNTYCHSPV